MDMRSQIKALETLYKIVNGGVSHIETVKPRFGTVRNEGKFEEVLPEQAGVRSEGLLKMFSELSDSSEICPHSMLVLRNGKLIAKADWKPFSSKYLHVSHSLCKSIAAMAAGIAAKEKYLSETEKISDIFADRMPASPNKYMNEITVRHLLTMSSGVRFNEAGAVMGENWREAFLSSDVMFEPGSDFNYNSLNTYMISAALCERTGLSLSEYLSRRLFSPMGITDFYWEKCPQGIEKGGWGLYMSVYDYAKLGQLYLNGGVWNGVQLVPEEWVIKSASRQISKADSPCYDGYGYQIWQTKNNNGYVFSGMFGQNVFVFPKRKIVISMTAGSSNLFPNCRAMNIITEFIENGRNFNSAPIKNFRYSNAAALRNSLSEARFDRPLPLIGRRSFIEVLRKSLSAPGTPDMIPEAAKILVGTEAVFEKNRAGLTPVLIQLMNGKFAGGIEKAAFMIAGAERSAEHIPEYKRRRGLKAVPPELAGGKFAVRFEGGGERIVVPISFTDEAAYFDYEHGGDSFSVGVNGSFTTDEDDFPVLKITMCFVETSCTKILKFIFRSDGVTLKIRESPQLYRAMDEAADALAPYLGKTVGKAVGSILETDMAEYKIKSFLEPTVKGHIVQKQKI